MMVLEYFLKIKNTRIVLNERNYQLLQQKKDQPKRKDSQDIPNIKIMLLSYL
jgi:hypothetical protein